MNIPVRNIDQLNFEVEKWLLILKVLKMPGFGVHHCGINNFLKLLREKNGNVYLLCMGMCVLF